MIHNSYSQSHWPDWCSSPGLFASPAVFGPPDVFAPSGKGAGLFPQVEEEPFPQAECPAAESLSSIVLTEGFSGENLYSTCEGSRGFLYELSIKGSPDALVTTITGEDLKRLNEDPDLLFTLTKFSLCLTPNITAEDATTFLLGLDPCTDLEELELDTPLTDTQLISILNKHSGLKKLSLWHTEQMTDKAFAALAERGSQLETLIIDGSSSSIKNLTVNKLFSSLAKVSLLFFTGMAPIDCDHLEMLFLKLKQIKICHLSALTGEAVDRCKEMIQQDQAASSNDWSLKGNRLYFRTAVSSRDVSQDFP